MEIFQQTVNKKIKIIKTAEKKEKIREMIMIFLLIL
jgi:hypothetical protein